MHKDSTERLDKCILCGMLECGDSAIYFDPDNFLCRACFKNGAFHSLPKELIANIYLEEAIDKGNDDEDYGRLMLKKSVEIYPSAKAYAQLAYLSKNLDDARNYNEIALKIDPDDAVSNNNMVRIYAALGEYSSALNQLEKVQKTYDYWDYLNEKARLLKSMGLMSEANSAFREAMNNPCRECVEKYMFEWNNNEWRWR